LERLYFILRYKRIKFYGSNEKYQNGIVMTDKPSGKVMMATNGIKFIGDIGWIDVVARGYFACSDKSKVPCHDLRSRRSYDEER
jgi:hypothetical protein